jgi:hypothetical protein
VSFRISLIASTVFITLACSAGAYAEKNDSAALAAPTAIVEDIEAPSQTIQMMDLLLPGSQINLAAGEKLTLSYFNSCTIETIVGGKITIGLTKSETQGSKIALEQSDDCFKGKFVLKTASAQAGAAVVFRGKKKGGGSAKKASKTPLPKRILKTTQPVIFFLGKSPKSIQLGDIFGLDVKQLPAENARIDFFARGITLEKDKMYVVEMDDSKVYLQISADAVAGNGPLLRRAVILDLR